MRIIAGRLGGRQFASPKGHRTHPMSDKMRGALFNALGDISGLTVLDAFAGSGAISFEAVSRGAAHAMAVERDRQAQQAIAESIEKLGISGQIKLIKASAGSWLGTSDDLFDIVVVDPPWEDPQINLLLRLADRTKPGGLFVSSIRNASDLSLRGNFHELSRKNLGDGSLTIFRRLS